MFTTPKHLGRWLAIAVAIGLVGCAAALAAKPPTPPEPVTPAYTIVPFVSPFPGPVGYDPFWSVVQDLNDWGQAVGYEEFTCDDTSPPVYHRQALHLDMATGTYTLLPDGSFARGVNNLNQIVGYAVSDGRLVGMFLRAPDAAPVDLPPLVDLGHTQSSATAINDAGVVAGFSMNDDRSSASAALWIVEVEGDAVLVHGPWALDPLEGGARGSANDLNEVIGGSCQVTGESFGAQGTSYEAALWTVDVAGKTATPGPAVSLVENNAWSVGSAINDLGDVCGILAVADGQGMPFLAPAGQTAQPLPVARNTQRGHAFAVNNLGEVVGRLSILPKSNWNGADYAYLWKDGGMFDLKTLIDRKSGWAHLSGATVINDAGVIGGYGSLENEPRATGFLLIPNPQ